jgi:hypothetical protein
MLLLCTYLRTVAKPHGRRARGASVAQGHNVVLIRSATRAQRPLADVIGSLVLRTTSDAICR